MPSPAETQRRKDAGLCITCGDQPNRKARWHLYARHKTKTLIPARLTCAACSDASRARNKKRRKTAAKLNVCELCMKRKRTGTKTRCKRCTLKYGTGNTAKVD